MGDVGSALEVMADPLVATGRTVGGSGSEPVRVIEMLRKKAESARSGNRGSGSKRKHDEVEIEESIGAGFELPYVGAAVACAGPSHQGRAEHRGPAADDESVAQDHHEHGNHSSNSSSDPSDFPPAAKRSDSGDKKMKDKGKKLPYPVVGVRVRPGREGPSVARKERAQSTTSSLSFVDGPLSSEPLTPAANGQQQHYSYPSTTPPPSETYPQLSLSTNNSNSHSNTMPPPIQADYPMSYAGPGVNGNTNNASATGRRKLSHEVGPQQGNYSPTPGMFEQGQPSLFASSSPASFGPGSNHQSPNPSFGGGNSNNSQLSSPSYLPSAEHSYGTPQSTGPASYYAPVPYQQTYDTNPQGSFGGLGLGLDVNTQVNEIVYDNDVKPQNIIGGSIPQMYNSGQQQQNQLGWQRQQQNNSNNVGAPQYWSTNEQPGYYP